MLIKLEELNANVKKEILINESISFSEEYFINSDIKELNDITVQGKIYKNSSEEIILNVNVCGNMLLEDSISLEDVLYPFSINIEENIEEILEKDKNSIDIIPILWQNIILEVPLRYTEVKDISSYSGDGWKLIGEEEASKNNPFLELKEIFKEE